jgi:hypothetical protein
LSNQRLLEEREEDVRLSQGSVSDRRRGIDIGKRIGGRVTVAANLRKLQGLNPSNGNLSSKNVT